MCRALPLTAADDLSQPLRDDVRLAVDRQHGVGQRVGRLPAARDRLEEAGRVGHHVADDLAPSRHALARQLLRRALVGAEEQRGETVYLDPVPLLRHREDRSCGGPPRRGRRAPRRSPRGRRRGSCSCPPARRPSRGAPARRRRESARSSPPGRPCAGRVGTAARAGRARRRTPATAPRPSAAPCATTTSSIPASRKASERGADLTNWGRFPTTVRMRIAALRYAALRGPLAQLVEQGTLNPKVEGSIPSRPTHPANPPTPAAWA